MPGAAILSWEDVRDTPRCAERRQGRHDRFDHGLTQREARMQERTPSVGERTPAVFVLGQAWTQPVTEGVVEPTHRTVVEPRPAACPRCGQTWSARGPQERPVATWVGAIRRRRWRWRNVAHSRLGSRPPAR